MNTRLLTPVIDSIKTEFDKSNQIQKKTSEKIKFHEYYNSTTLKQIRSSKRINDDGLKVISNIIDQFAVRARVTKSKMIDLLLYNAQ